MHMYIIDVSLYYDKYADVRRVSYEVYINVGLNGTIITMNFPN